MNHNKLVGNFLWRFFERCGAQGVTFLVSIVLARLLEPTVYGTLALVTVFTAVMQVFADGGFGNALIQKKDADALDFSSVFYFNVTMCTALYLLLYAAAPWIARFYRLQELTPLVRVAGLTIVISGVKNVQQAYVSRNMLFKRFFFATLGGTVGAAAVGIGMALCGLGVWALVAQNLVNLFLDTLILWVTVGWRPQKMFSWARLQGLLKYGWKLLASRLIDTGYNELRSLLIGRVYHAESLAFYNRGKQFPHLIVTNINDSIDSVLFPTMSQEQKNPETIRRMTSRAIQISVYLMAPLMIGMAACAEPLICLLLKEKWLPAVFFLRTACVVYLFWPIHTANLNAIKALGRSDLFLKLELIKKGIGTVLLVVSVPFGVKAIAVSAVFQSMISQVVNSWPNRKLLQYRYWDQLRDIAPPLLLSLGMGIVVYTISLLHWADWLTLLIQIPVGAAVYILGSALWKLDSFCYLLEIGKKLLRSRKRNM